MDGAVVGSNGQGDLQMHTLWSDGSASIGEMAEAGEDRGYEYIAITVRVLRSVEVNLSPTREVDYERVFGSYSLGIDRSG